MTRLFPTQFVLVGSMNPEEGLLRPQILDRLGLRVWVAPLTDRAQRLEIYRRTRDFRHDPEGFRARYAAELERLREEVSQARTLLAEVTIDTAAEEFALGCVQILRIPSHRAEITLLEAARARAAADGRAAASVEDVRQIAPMALRQRRSLQLETYAAQLGIEDQTIQETMARLDGAPRPKGRRLRTLPRSRGPR